MNKLIKIDGYEMNIRLKEITINDLLSHYHLKKVEGYCKECPNYDKIWSCPPFDFVPFNYLKKYSKAKIYSGEIIFDLSEFNKKEKVNQVRQIYDIGRKEFRNFLITLEEKYHASEALIAGHCFLCDECTRSEGKKCIKPDMIRYSLESMGIEVGPLLKETLNQALQWNKDETDGLITVGAILIK